MSLIALKIYSRGLSVGVIAHLDIKLFVDHSILSSERERAASLNSVTGERLSQKQKVVGSIPTHSTSFFFLSFSPYSFWGRRGGGVVLGAKGSFFFFFFLVRGLWSSQATEGWLAGSWNWARGCRVERGSWFGPGLLRGLGLGLLGWRYGGPAAGLGGQGASSGWVKERTGGLVPSLAGLPPPHPTWPPY